MGDTTLELECPACGKVMTKLYIKEAGINLDICLDGCGGIFFDNRELEKFDEKHENIEEILTAIENKHFKSTDDTETRICPICKIPMPKRGAADGEIQIDVCNICNAKFLDNGELQKIREYENKNNTKIDELLNTMYEENFNEVAGNAKSIIKGSEKRRQFFEDFAKRYFV